MEVVGVWWMWVVLIDSLEGSLGCGYVGGLIKNDGVLNTFKKQNIMKDVLFVVVYLKKWPPDFYKVFPNENIDLLLIKSYVNYL